MRPPKFPPTGDPGGARAPSRYHPARSVFDTRCRRASGACRSSRLRAHRRPPPADRRCPARTPDKRHRPRHPPCPPRRPCSPVAGIAAYVSYGHAYAVVRAHGETGVTARLEPAAIDGLVYASSMVVLYAARHRVAVPSARWLLGLGIAATLTANMAQGGCRSRTRSRSSGGPGCRCGRCWHDRGTPSVQPTRAAPSSEWNNPWDNCSHWS